MQENLAFTQEKSREVQASIAALKVSTYLGQSRFLAHPLHSKYSSGKPLTSPLLQANPFSSSHISTLERAVNKMLVWLISSAKDPTSSSADCKLFRGIAVSAYAVLRAHAAF